MIDTYTATHPDGMHAADDLDEYKAAVAELFAARAAAGAA